LARISIVKTKIFFYILTYAISKRNHPWRLDILKIDAVMFDLDGLLADTEDFHVLAYDEVAKSLGIKLPRDYIVSFIGAPTAVNLRRLMKDYGIPESRFEELLKIRYDRYIEIVKTTPLAPMDGALECVTEIKKKGFKTALVTSSLREHSLAVLENISKNTSPGIDIKKLFDIMVFGDEIKELKPAPDIYIKAVASLKTKPERCIALEDSEAGVASAKAAGLIVIAVPCPHTKEQKFERADFVVKSLREVLKLPFLDGE
jgi:beta-phosphoglucomutase-like phosphatase (HAD superfamily)